MRIWSDGWKILRVHGVLERYRSQLRQDLGHNGDGTTKEHKRSAKPQRQGSSAEQVRVKGNGQMPTFLLHIEEVLRVDGRVSDKYSRT